MLSRERQGCAAPASLKSLPFNAVGMIFPGSRGFGKGVPASHLTGGCGFSLIAVVGVGWVGILGSWRGPCGDGGVLAGIARSWNQWWDPAGIEVSWKGWRGSGRDGRVAAETSEIPARDRRILAGAGGIPAGDGGIPAGHGWIPAGFGAVAAGAGSLAEIPGMPAGTAAMPAGNGGGPVGRRRNRDAGGKTPPIRL